MRKSPTIKPRVCVRCNQTYTPRGNTQQYCEECKKIREIEKHSNRKPKTKCTLPCCVCGGKFSAFFDGSPYCNKHWQRMYHNGTIIPKVRAKTCSFDVSGDLLTITTKSGSVIIADSEDFEKLSKHSWCIDAKCYPVANVDGKITAMQRFLMNPPKGMVVDHMNGDKLDNRKSNLRICTPRQNAQNQRGNKGRELPIGIRKTKAGKYVARICVDRKSIHIGTFQNIDDAVSAREKAEIQYFGVYAQHLHSKYTRPVTI